MKKLMLSFLGLLAFTLVACGPSRVQIQEMSSSCDVLIEIHHVQNDSIAIFVGNSMFINAQQLIRDEVFPFLVSKRNPTDIDIPTATTVLNSKEEFVDYIKGNVSTFTSYGIVIGKNVSNEIGFDEAEAIEKVKGLLESIKASSVILFHEQDGQLIKAKKL
ncbi:MAG TPA: hypothetical protein GX724_06665 [Fibrobacter sp.]|nr:hypothetical protein [Fibrobacter sp.]